MQISERKSGAMRSADDRLGALARRQHGLVTSMQLLEAGLSRDAVYRRTKSGRLRRLHRGVYLVGPVMPERALEMAAVLACGPTAFLSHRSAAWLWSITRNRAEAAPVDVMIVGGGGAQRPGIRVHRVAALDPADRTTLDRIPVTSPGRTLVDFASMATLRELERAVAIAEREGWVTHAELQQRVAQATGRRGVRALRKILTARHEPAFTRSEAEERFLRLVRESRLPEPEVNMVVDGLEIDFYWPRARVAVEVDGYGFHSSRSSFETDRRRGSHLAAKGIHVVRLTWRQIVEEGTATAVQLGQLLMQAERR